MCIIKIKKKKKKKKKTKKKKTIKRVNNNFGNSREILMLECAHFTGQVRAPVKFESRVMFESSSTNIYFSRFYLNTFYCNSYCLNDLTVVVVDLFLSDTARGNTL